MAKFYVECDQFRYVVSAADGEGAALWFVEKVMSESFGVKSVNGIHPDFLSGVLSLIADEMGDEILISEVGFGRSEVAIADAKVLLNHWLQLANSMFHLINQL